MKTILIIGVLVVALVVGVHFYNVSESDRAERIAQAQTEFNNVAAEQIHSLDVQTFDATIRLAEMEQGDVAAAQLRECKVEGYLGPKNPGSVSNRRKAICNAIVSKVDKESARMDAQERAKDEAY